MSYYNDREYRTFSRGQIAGSSEYSINCADLFDRDYIEEEAIITGDFVSVYRAADYV